MRHGVGLGHLGTDSIENSKLLEPADLKVGVGGPDQRDIANTQVLDRPVGNCVEIGPAAEATENGPDQVASAAETARTEADENRRREGESLAAMEKKKKKKETT